MTRFRSLSLCAAVLLCTAANTQLFAAEIVGCVVAKLEGNTSYYGTATVFTKLKCEFQNPDYHSTLTELYQRGWRLIEVVGGDHAIAMGNSGPSPLYLLERESSPAPAEPEAGAAAKDANSSSTMAC